MGKQSISWLPNTYPKNGMMWEVRFARKDCTPCVHRAQCTPGQEGTPHRRASRRGSSMRRCKPRATRQTTEAFHQQYAPRAGIESTHAQGIRRCGLRQARYIGLAKTHLQHLATAAALNVVRLGEWWAGTPQAKTRYSPFTRLKVVHIEN